MRTVIYLEIAIIAATVAMGAAAHLGHPLNHDTSYYLIAVGWWLDGVPLYDEILDINPPLTFYLTIPAVVGGDAFGVTRSDAMVVWVLALVALSLGASGYGLRQAGVGAAPRLAFLLGAGFALVPLALPVFAQREHLLAVFAMPYLLTAAAGPPKGRSVLAMIGTFAALGVILKPVFLWLPLTVTLALCIRQRSPWPVLSAQNVTIYAVGVAYVAFTAVVHPSYLHEIVPRALLIYDAYQRPMEDLIPAAILPVFALVLCTVLGWRLRGLDHAAQGVLIAAVLAGLAIYFWQSKGWAYHLYPVRAFVGLLGIWTVYGLIADRHRVLGGVAVAGTAIGLLIGAPPLGVYQNLWHQPIAQHFTCAPGQRSYQVLNSQAYPSFPLANEAGAEPAGRGSMLWLIPGTVRGLADPETTPETRARLRDLMDEARDLIIADFQRLQPQLLIVDVRAQKPYFGDAEFDYLAFLREDQAFGQAFAAYNQVTTLYGQAIFRRPGCP